jgi:dipeptidyl aminopeptidase/acylaminoacyl peptidase
MNSIVRTITNTFSMTLMMLVLPAVVMAQAEPGTLSLELYLDMESVSSPRISPDGAQIVYTRSWVDKVNDRRSSDVWITNADGSRNRFLVKGSSPTWSPDGTRIAFLAQGEPRGSQIFVRWMDAEGATTQITHVEKSPGSLRWSPDGERIAFTMSVDDRSSWSVKLPPRPEGANWTEGPRIVDRLNYRRDRESSSHLSGWRTLNTSTGNQRSTRLRWLMERSRSSQPGAARMEAPCHPLTVS